MKWLKKKIINWIIDATMDAIIYALHNMAKDTTSKVDDKIVKLLDAEQENLKLEITSYLNAT